MCLRVACVAASIRGVEGWPESAWPGFVTGDCGFWAGRKYESSSLMATSSGYDYKLPLQYDLSHTPVSWSHSHPNTQCKHIVPTSSLDWCPLLPSGCSRYIHWQRSDTTSWFCTKPFNVGSTWCQLHDYLYKDTGWTSAICWRGVQSHHLLHPSSL